MKGTCILMGSFHNLDKGELVYSHVACQLFLPLVLPSHANLRELKGIFGIVKNDGITRRMDNMMNDDFNKREQQNLV